MNESRLSIVFLEKVFQSGMINKNNYIKPYEIGLSLFKSKDNH